MKFLKRHLLRLFLFFFPYYMQFIRSHVERETLVLVRNLVRSIAGKLSNLFNFAISRISPDLHHPLQPITNMGGSFDPAEPSAPVSYPITTLEELESGSYFKSFHYPFNKASVALESDPVGTSGLPDRPRLLVCHDMAGGYSDDKWAQGGTNPDAYAIWHWYLIDIFVYFSHSLVTIPPPCWINAAHRHGVKVLGTFITEWDEGKRICDILLATKESAHMYAEMLKELAVALGFDGWLINMEVKLDATQIPQMKEFVSHLTQIMHSSKHDSLVIWYDSVTVDGDLSWQDQLNDKNKPFFDLCDGIFINYTWKEAYPRLSASAAGQRKFDVYMGIDVFGRNTFGGGEWNTGVALDVIKKEDVSAAIFAPGWVYETKQPPDFQTAQNRWWHLVEKSWGIAQSYPRMVPFYSNFDQGHGYHLSIGGDHVSDASWCNISCQSFQPLLEVPEGLGSNSTIEVLVDFKEQSYSGGGNVTLKGSLEGKDYFLSRLFKGKLPMEEAPLYFTYSVNSNGESLLGLLLELHSAADEQITVLLASWVNPLLIMNRFSRQFSKVILPNKVIETAQGWFIMEHVISLEGYTLSNIHAVCYMLKPDSAELEANSTLASGVRASSVYHAVLGHISIKSQNQNLEPPPPESWVVDVELVEWVAAPQGSKYLSLKLVWGLKGGCDPVFSKYYVRVQKIFKHESNSSSARESGEASYLGVAQVEAFYVSDLLVSSGICQLKFIVQACSADGTTQRLDESPSFVLTVEG